MRSAMEAGLREVCRSVRIGGLNPRLKETRSLSIQHRLLIKNFENRLATGGSAMKAVDVLMEHGVGEERIIFINLISSPEGLETFCAKFPRLKVITGWIDQGLNAKAYIIPGLGDFGERRYCE
ncbi:hypothetical protein D9757_011760 [Collybiopsis confluens]|uniref:Phosphoribosyltransferase domain-containing protein n=1 Tax=Collybiopsis confluens TaxID=2823264 RepID=A0A8H5GHI7_9AGAR|nr:hypothetical protein D9757_011760 [Collybiopsis confluens]